MGKLAGEVAGPGVGWFVGVELPVASVATAQLRQAPGDDSIHETEGKRVRVSAVSMGSAVEGSEGRGKQRHSGFVLDGNLRLRRARGM